MGIISNELMKDVRKRADELIQLGPIGEMLDGPIIGVVLNFLDDNYGDKIPTEYQDEVVKLFEIFAYERYEELDDLAASLLHEIVDLPFASEDATAQWIAQNVRMIYGFVLWLATRKARV